MDKKGFKIVKKKGKIEVKSEKGEIVMQGEWCGLYIMHCITVPHLNLLNLPS